MELEELIVEIVIGLFLLFISYQIGIKENITLLHGYHYTCLLYTSAWRWKVVLQQSSGVLFGVVWRSSTSVRP